MSELTLLLYVMAMVTGTAVISWLAVALPMKIATGASLRFALANLFFLLSVALTLQRTSVASFWFWPVADLLGIVAIVVLRSGTRKLFKQAATTVADGVGLLLLCMLYLPQSYDGHSASFYGIAYSLAMAIVTALICHDVFRAARQEFSAQTAASIAWPFGAVALAMLLRASLIASTGKAIPLDAGASPVPFDSTYSMLAYVFLLLILNLTLFACVITRLIAKLRNYSERDYLTGLLNRRAFEARLSTERLRSERTGNEFSLLLFDIDHFKQINDQFGHNAGDLALRHVARCIKDALRQIDLFARFGGEEFIVLLPETPLATALQVAERLRHLLEQTPLTIAGKAVPVRASFGCVSSRAGEVSQLLNLADKAMYRAKADGRNQVRLAPEREAES